MPLMKIIFRFNVESVTVDFDVNICSNILMAY